jgi:8-oxo-dGTP pyrophosphatase MutT (NUDIX family)
VGNTSTQEAVLLTTRLSAQCQQAGVIPYRFTGARVEVMLITSSRRGRWIIPKGNIEPGTSAVLSAREEAWEEGGVTGTISEIPAGLVQYRKQGRLLTAVIYFLRVGVVHDSWPEQGKRLRKWLSPAEAAEAIREPALRALIAKL